MYTGIPKVTIKARQNDDAITVGSLGKQRMHYIENERQYNTNIDSAWYSQTQLKSTPMFYFDVPEGEWSVDVTCEGAQASKSTTEPNKGKADGLIAYTDVADDGWGLGGSYNVQVSSYQNDGSWLYGHPDLEVNSCHFKNSQCLERDAVISCHLKTTGPNAQIFVIAPPIQKQAKYNYTISYGEWTDRLLDLGQLTVVFDEVDATGSAHMRKILSLTSAAGNGHSGTTSSNISEPPLHPVTEETAPIEMGPMELQAISDQIVASGFTESEIFTGGLPPLVPKDAEAASETSSRWKAKFGSRKDPSPRDDAASSASSWRGVLGPGVLKKHKSSK